MGVPPSATMTSDADRGLVREAAKPLMNEKLRMRFSKSGSNRFTEYWFHEVNMRDYMCDGLLSHSGLIDRAALIKIFSKPCSFSEKQQVIDALHVEIWMRSIQ